MTRESGSESSYLFFFVSQTKSNPNLLAYPFVESSATHRSACYDVLKWDLKKKIVAKKKSFWIWSKFDFSPFFSHSSYGQKFIRIFSSPSPSSLSLASLASTFSIGKVKIRFCFVSVRSIHRLGLKDNRSIVSRLLWSRDKSFHRCFVH